MELSSVAEDGSPIQIKIKLVGDVALGDHSYFQVYGILVRKSFEHLKLQLVGRNFFDPIAKVMSILRTSGFENSQEIYHHINVPFFCRSPRRHITWNYGQVMLLQFVNMMVVCT